MLAGGLTRPALGKGENSQLKRIVADKELENLALKEIAKGNF